jgi:hypothetical protein
VIPMNMAVYAATKSYITGQPINMEDAVVALFNLGTGSFAASPVSAILDSMGFD